MLAQSNDDMRKIADTVRIPEHERGLGLHGLRRLSSDFDINRIE